MIWQDNAYLMVDLELVDSTEGCGWVRSEACKHPDNPILFRSPGTEDDAAGNPELLTGRPLCICLEGGIWRGWFALDSRQTAYGESDDGIHWIYHQTVPVAPEGTIFNDLIHDPLDADFPFKSLILVQRNHRALNRGVAAKYPASYANMVHHKYTGWYVCGFARSRDGLSWEPPDLKQILIDEIIEEPHAHRALDGGWCIGNQMVTQASDIGYRKIKGWVTYDGKSAARLPDYVFKIPDHLAFVQQRHLGKTAIDDTPWVQSHVQLVPARKGPSVVALHGYLYGAPKLDRFAHRYEVGLAVSSTGYGFRQVLPFQSFLRRGDMGRWDSTSIRQQAMVETADETRIYYLGATGGNASTRMGYPYHGYGTGIATLPRDRFGFFHLWVNLDTTRRARRGTVCLRPLSVPAKPRLTINADNLTPRQTIRLELRRVDGSPIPGFTFDDCQPLTQSGLDLPVHWNNANIHQLASETIQPAIELSSDACGAPEQESPHLYAIYTA